MSGVGVFPSIPGPNEGFVCGNFDVTVAGTAEAMPNTHVLEVVIQAKSTNTGLIYVGGSSVSSTDGIELSAGQSMSFQVTNLNKLWLDASVSGDGVKWTASKE